MVSESRQKSKKGSRRSLSPSANRPVGLRRHYPARLSRKQRLACRRMAVFYLTHLVRRPRSAGRFLWGMTVVFLLAGLASAVVGFSAVRTIYKELAADLPDIPLASPDAYPQTVRIFDRKGGLLFATGGASDSIYVGYDDIAPALVKAIMAIEDKRFFRHAGFDPRALIRAALADLAAGRIVQGGSTITQQLSRLLFLEDEARGWDKKLREIVLAVRLEQIYSKTQLLELYLNKLPFGSNLVGVEAASQRFFGKKAAQLSLAEAATLAAMPRAPSYYYVFQNQAALRARRDLVINLMLEQGLISEAEAAAARHQPLSFQNKTAGLTAPHFTFLVLNQLAKVFGKKSFSQGLDITTTLDRRLQDLAEAATASIVSRNYQSRYRADNAALVAIDGRTGEVLAMSGSVAFDKAGYGQFNVAVAERQPGSALKPFIYALAFERLGLNPQSRLTDQPVSFDGYQPLNYDRRFHGLISAHDALVHSYNIPAVTLLADLGVATVVERLNQCGVGLNPSAGLSLAIGGAATNLLDLTRAYTAFTREGTCLKPPLWLTVKDRSGRLRYSVKPETLAGKRVFDPSSVRAVNDILADTLKTFAFTLPLARDPRFAGVKMKTGTSDGPRDAWVIGYSNDLIVGVWVGNHDDTPMKKEVLALKVAVPLWREFMEGYWRLKGNF